MLQRTRHPRPGMGISVPYAAQPASHRLPCEPPHGHSEEAQQPAEQGSEARAERGKLTQILLGAVG